MMARTGFSGIQLAILMVIGAALWFGAAVLLRSLAGAGWLEGEARALVYAFVIPGTIPFVMLTQALARLRAEQVAIGVAMVTATALLLDGAAVAWFPQLYGDTDARVLAASAAVLWGAGVAIMLGFAWNRMPAPRP
jgi:hypothetical protein